MLQEDCVACSQVPQELEMKLSDKLQDVITTLTESLTYQVSIAMTLVTKVKYFVLYLNLLGEECERLCTTMYINIRKWRWVIKKKFNFFVFTLSDEEPRTNSDGWWQNQVPVSSFTCFNWGEIKTEP